MNLNELKSVLILAPHPDDAEFSSGATVSKFIEEGKEIYYAVFSMCEKSVPEGLPENSIELELDEAAANMGIDPSHVLKYKYPVREFPKYRQEILEDLVKLNRELEPELVLMPSRYDTHQDHLTIHEEGLRAFKKTNLLGYEMPWNNFTFTSSVYFVIDRPHLDKKLEVLECYKTQQSRNYSGNKFIEALATVRGVQINEELAEAFEIIRWIIK